MPLRCVDETGAAVYAFDLTSEQWLVLRDRNRETQTLRMPCCSTAVILRRSRRGTQHFAHKAVGTCATAPETEAHLQLKRIAVEVARRHGWDATTEVGGIAPSGEEWVADVLAKKNSAKVAIEIQWSPQANDETMRRQERYRQSGIRCLWLLRKPGFPTTDALPAAQVLENSGIYTVRIGLSQEMPVEAFLDAAFAGRLRFGIPANIRAFASIRVGEMECWKPQCGTTTRIVTGIAVAFGSHMVDFSVADLEEHRGLVQEVLRHLPAILRLDG